VHSRPLASPSAARAGHFGLVGLAVAASLGCGKAASTSAVTALPPDAIRSDADAAVAANAHTVTTTVNPTVTAMPETGREASVRVTLARTERERARGLMYVQNLPPDDGMLFIWDGDDERSFWMKNTLIPLDMVFIRSDMTVVGVVANAKPLTTNPQTVGKDSRFVLEVNGGWAAQHGVVAGTKVRFDAIPL
jgi:uncharacterized membrane protein (UPF0127 family)